MGYQSRVCIRNCDLPLDRLFFLLSFHCFSSFFPSCNSLLLSHLIPHSFILIPPFRVPRPATHSCFSPGLQISHSKLIISFSPPLYLHSPPQHLHLTASSNNDDFHLASTTTTTTTAIITTSKRTEYLCLSTKLIAIPASENTYLGWTCLILFLSVCAPPPFSPLPFNGDLSFPPTHLTQKTHRNRHIHKHLPSFLISNPKKWPETRQYTNTTWHRGYSRPQRLP